MIDFPRSCFIVVATLLRQHSGGRIVGFLALLHALSGLVFFTAAMLFLRGFARDTAVASWLAVPMLIPMLLFTLVFIGVWIGRSFGVLRYAGPLRLVGPNDGFTGHAGEMLRARFNVEHEWTLLERYEPALIAGAGVVLAFIPWTRVIGMYLVLMSIADAWQSTRDRRVNAWEQNPQGEFAEPLSDVIARGEDVEFSFGNLGDVAELLDDEAQEHVQAHAAAHAGSEPLVSVAPGVWFKPRGPISVHRKPRVTPVLVGAVVLLVGNFTAGDVLGLYERSPARWISAVQSLQSAGATVGLLEPATETSMGGLTDAFLEKIDSDALTDWKEERVDEVIAEARRPVAAAESALQSLRLAVVSDIGLELDPESHSELLDELFLSKQSVRDAWAALLNGSSELEAAITRGYERLRSEENRGAGASLDEVRDIGKQAEDWKKQAEGMQADVEHIRVMLDAMRLERAMNTKPEGGG